MKDQKSSNKAFAPVIAIIVLIIIAFFSIKALGNLGKDLGSGKDTTGDTSAKTVPETTEKEPVPQEKTETQASAEDDSGDKDTGCVWKTIEREVPAYVLDKENVVVTDKKIINYTYEFQLSNDPERSIRKTIDDESYDAFTPYDKASFSDFYKNFELKGWFIDTGVSKYESVNSDAEFSIENTGNTSGIYTILRVYTSEKDNRYYDEKQTSIRVEIKPDDVKKIEFKDSVICYVLGNANESDSTQPITLMRDFMKKRPYGMTQEDLIVFPTNGKNVACVRPYFVIVPDTYQKEEITSEEVTRQFYRATTKHTQEIVCE